MQTECTAPGNLLNDTGELNARGWARHPVARYNRERIAAPWFRVKEWDYYCVLASGYGIALTISDVGYLADISVSWLDFETHTEVTETIMKPLSRGSLNLPRSVDEGDVAYHDKHGEVRFTRNPASRVLSIDFPGFDHGRGIRGSLRLDQDPGQERMVIMTPFANAPKAFYYNQKLNCMPATGTITVGGVEYAFSSETDSGVLDWGRGVWPYRTMWYWGSGSGHVGGHSFGFNVGYGFGDTSAATENVLFWDGHIHKLEHVEFQIPPDSFLKPWKFVSSDHRFDIDFEPTLDRHARTDIGILKTVQHQVFGTFTGIALLDDGTPVRLDRFPGFAEKVLNRW
jgi:hypothetical protein